MRTPMSGRRRTSSVSDGEPDDRSEQSGEPAVPDGEDERRAREDDDRERPTLSSDGAYALLWGVVAIVAAALSFDGSVDPVAGLAGVTGAVGFYTAARDLLRGRPPASLEYLWMGTPALLGAGIAAFDGRLLAAGGLGVVALATLVEGYGWFGAGDDGEDSGSDREVRVDDSEEHRDDSEEHRDDRNREGENRP